jgi:hypothetical protein
MPATIGNYQSGNLADTSNYRFKIPQSRIYTPPKQPPKKKSNELWVWLGVLFADVLLSIGTWYLGGFAGEIAGALDLTPEIVSTGIRVARYGIDFASNIGGAKATGQLSDWRVLYSIAPIGGAEGLGATRMIWQDIKWFSKLQKDMREIGIPQEYINSLKQSTKILKFRNEIKFANEIHEKAQRITSTFVDSVSNDELSEAIESQTSTFAHAQGIGYDQELAKLNNKVLKKQLTELFGKRINLSLAGKEADLYADRTSNLIVNLNKKVYGIVERKAFNSNFKYSSLWLKAKLSRTLQEDGVKYMGASEFSGIDKINYFIGVSHSYTKFGRYLNPTVLSRRIGSAVWWTISKAMKKAKLKNSLAREMFEQGGMARIVKRKVMRRAGKVIRKADVILPKAWKDHLYYWTAEEERAELEIRFNIIPVSSSWIAGYKVFALPDKTYMLEIFFLPSATKSKNMPHGKAPIITQPMTILQLTTWANINDKGRYYATHFAWGKINEWVAYGLNFGGRALPTEYSRLAWGGIKQYRDIKGFMRGIKAIHEINKYDTKTLLENDFSTRVIRRALSFTGFGIVLSPFLTTFITHGGVSGESLGAGLKQFVGRRRVQYVRRFRRRHRSGNKSLREDLKNIF